ncbi:MAG: hypothetical protein ACI4JK_07550 [Oscillospiraceae bacterium]
MKKADMSTVLNVFIFIGAALFAGSVYMQLMHKELILFGYTWNIRIVSLVSDMILTVVPLIAMRRKKIVSRNIIIFMSVLCWIIVIMGVWLISKEIYNTFVIKR